MKLSIVLSLAVLATTSISFAAPASAQGSRADRAVEKLAGKWISGLKGRTINFQIKNDEAIFEDEIEPGIILTGGFKRDESGAGYVLTYSKGFECRYSVDVPSGADGNALSLRLTGSDEAGSKGRFECIEGMLTRTSR